MIGIHINDRDSYEARFNETIVNGLKLYGKEIKYFTVKERRDQEHIEQLALMRERWAPKGTLRSNLSGYIPTEETPVIQGQSKMRSEHNSQNIYGQQFDTD